ncbi:hypothetical protein DFH07DRAFT_943079 [Mycena maculata]|uniref:F-box domain-containing protein n=1 Tax=Mycena maculata TaxID=230809 RepID=A0AAD7ILH1_9AGAR|nr:hypothetical protein DFH07DRAFT_943079 [Mycena maculata]
MTPCWNCGTPFLPDNTPSPSTAFRELSHLVAGNEPPQDSEVLTLRKVIAAEQERIDALNTRIETLQSTLTRLVEERTAREELIHQHATILSPIRRIPAEILCEIFYWLPCTRRLGSHTVDCPPWWAGNVCSYWRDSALGDPYLWNSIHLFHSQAFPVEKSVPASMLEAQHLRSANEPLQVTILSWGSDDVEHSWLNILLSQSNRWASLRIVCRPAFSLLGLLCPLKNQLTQLMAIELHNNIPDTDGFSVAPKLRHALLAHGACQHLSSIVPLPWHQITHYRGVYKAQYQLHILRAAADLVECGLGFGGPDPTQLNAISGQVAFLPRLRRLHLRLSRFLDHLEAPALTDLFLVGDVDPLPSFLHRSSCQLTKLVLTYSTASETLRETLKSIPGLTHLTLEPNFGGQQGTKELFRAMQVSDGLSTICPNLTEFAYGDRRLGDIAAGLFAMVRSRLRLDSPCRLLFFRLWIHSPTPGTHQLPDDVAGQIDLLCEEGIDAAYISHGDAAKWIGHRRP